MCYALFVVYCVFFVDSWSLYVLIVCCRLLGLCVLFVVVVNGSLCVVCGVLILACCA